MTQHKKHNMFSAPSFDEIKDAAKAFNAVGTKTPILENKEVNKALGARILIKDETAQRTGAFKFRGAYNRMRQLSEKELNAGVITYSSGNHGQAVALAATLFGTQVTIVMPDDAPLEKINDTHNLGATIKTYDRNQETRQEAIIRFKGDQDLIEVPPSEDRRVLAGAGTVALEFIEQAKENGVSLDIVLVPCGGGGLTAATALVFEEQSPNTKIYAVEPELFDDTKKSFEAGRRIANKKGQKTICDAIMTDIPGELTFSINKEKLSGVLTVSDEEVEHAVAFAFKEYKAVIEPGAAVGLAAILANKIDIENQHIGIIATGGNVEHKTFCNALKNSTAAKP